MDTNGCAHKIETVMNAIGNRRKNAGRPRLFGLHLFSKWHHETSGPVNPFPRTFLGCSARPRSPSGCYIFQHFLFRKNQPSPKNYPTPVGPFFFAATDKPHPTHKTNTPLPLSFSLPSPSHLSYPLSLSTPVNMQSQQANSANEVRSLCIFKYNIDRLYPGVVILLLTLCG